MLKFKILKTIIAEVEVNGTTYKVEVDKTNSAFKNTKIGEIISAFHQLIQYPVLQKLRSPTFQKAQAVLNLLFPVLFWIYLFVKAIL